MILKKEAIESISQKLSLPYTGIEQDWELEMASSDRVSEFVSYYKKTPLSRDEKMALMSLILASYDDFLNEKNLDQNKLWDEIRDALKSEESMFSELLAYWRLDDENIPENYFKITPLIRELR